MLRTKRVDYDFANAAHWLIPLYERVAQRWVRGTLEVLKLDIRHLTRYSLL